MRRKTAEAAAKLGKAPATLAKWRLSGEGPRYFKIGRHAYYDDEDLEAYIETQRRATISQPKPQDAAPATSVIGDRSPWQDGFNAARDLPRTCPYELGTKPAWSWLAGLIEGMAAGMPVSRSGNPDVNDGASRK